MKGLLLKEYYILCNNYKIYLLYILIFGGTSLLTGNVSLFCTVLAVITTTIPLASFSVDDTSGWSRMVAVTSVSRRTVVRSKYLLTLFLVVISFVLSLIMVILVKLLHPDIGIVEGIASMLASLLVMCLGMMALFPILFKYGAERGRLAFMLVFGVTFAGILGFAMLASRLPENLRSGIAGGVLPAVFVGLPLVLALAVWLSYRTSLRVYRKKEL